MRIGRWFRPSLKPDKPLKMPEPEPVIRPIEDDVLLRIVSDADFERLATAAGVDRKKGAFATWGDRPTVRVVKTPGQIVMRASKVKGLLAHELDHIQSKKGH